MNKNNKRAEKASGAVLAGLCVWLATLAAGAGEPKVVLDVPLDGSADAAFAADGCGKGSYTTVRYAAGKAGQGAEFGSTALPCGLVFAAERLLDKSSGTLELWYKPRWSGSDAGQARPRRTLACSDAARRQPGRLWLTTGWGSIQFGIDVATGKRATVSLSAKTLRAGSWHHIVATWDCNDGVRLVLDGRLVSAKGATWGRVPVSRHLFFGRDERGTRPCDGLLDGIRLYDAPLSIEQVKLAYAGKLTLPNAPVRKPAPEPAPKPRRPARLIFHLPFDGSAAAKVAGGNGTPVEAKSVRFARGLDGQALDAGSGIRLAYAAKGNLDKQAGAVSMWVKLGRLAEPPSRAFFADDLNTWDSPAQVGNALWLWLWWSGTRYRVRFDVRPPLIQYAVRDWMDGGWHHMVGCWRRGEAISLYVDGQRRAHVQGPAADYKLTPSKKLFVGSWGDRYAAFSLIDDLRVYDAPLTPEEVAQLTSKHILPLTLQLGQTLFETGRDATLALRFYNRSGRAVRRPAVLAVTVPDGSTLPERRGEVAIPKAGWGEWRVPLPAKAIQATGRYGVACRLGGQEMLGYFLAVPPIPRERPGDGAPDPVVVARVQVDAIDCVRDTKPERFASTGSSTVVTSPLGSYREAGPTRGDRMSFRFRVPKAGVPYVAVVTYPDDKVRSCDIVKTSPKFNDRYDVASGYYCGDDVPLGYRMVALPLYFWPRERDNALTFMTLENGRPAAAARIDVHALTQGMPSVAMANIPPDGGRRIGLYWEDPTITLEHGGTDFSPPEVYKSVARLVDYLRFTGQNLICYPIAWYSGTMFPTPREDFRLGAGASRKCNDWVEYVLRVCEARSVRFLPEMYYAGSMKLHDAHKGETAAHAAAGKPVVKNLMWDGRVSPGLYFEPPLYNILHPTVQRDLAAYVEDTADRYGRYKALEGISLIVGEGNCVWFGSIQSGYDDYTVGLFEKETGVRVPAAKTGAARFSQRFRWLTANARERWVSWRCKKIHALFADLAARIRNRRPDLKLYLTFYAIDGHMWNPLFKLNTWRPDGRPTDQIYREGGFDTRLYRSDAGIVVRRVAYPIDYRFYKSHYGGTGGPNAHPVLARDIDLLSEGIAPFKQSATPAVAFHCRYFESAIGRDKPIPGHWWPCHRWRVSQPTASGRNTLEYYAQTLAELDATSFAYGGYSVLTMGHEVEIRDWARALRPLPRRRFEDIPWLHDPICGRQLLHDGKHYIYFVNRLPVQARVRFVFDKPGVTIRDLRNSRDFKLVDASRYEIPAPLPEGFVSEHALPAKPGPVRDPQAGRVRLKGSLIRLRLAPYSLRSYTVHPPEAKLIYAYSEAHENEINRLESRLADAQRLMAGVAAPQGVLAEARRTLALAERALRKREFSRASLLLDSFPLTRLLLPPQAR